MFLRNNILFIVLTGLIQLVSIDVRAQSINANVIGPGVGEPGQTMLEYRAGYERDDLSPSADKRFSDRIDFFYSITDTSQIQLFVNRVDPGNDDSEITSYAIQPRFELYQQDTDGFTGAIVPAVIFQTDRDRPDFARVAWASDSPVGENWMLRANGIIGHQFGNNSESGVTLGIRGRATYETPWGPRIGPEFFSAIGNLETFETIDERGNRAGIVVEGFLSENISYQAGYLRGLTDVTPDHAGKLWIRYHF